MRITVEVEVPNGNTCGFCEFMSAFGGTTWNYCQLFKAVTPDFKKLPACVKACEKVGQGDEVAKQ